MKFVRKITGGFTRCRQSRGEPWISKSVENDSKKGAQSDSLDVAFISVLVARHNGYEIVPEKGEAYHLMKRLTQLSLTFVILVLSAAIASAAPQFVGDVIRDEMTVLAGNLYSGPTVLV